MTMTTEEIVRHWQQAKKRDAAELQLLAELNATSTAEIRQLLKEAGEVLPASSGKKNYASKFQELYGQGLTDKEIASRVSCTPQAVANWRKNNRLHRNEEKDKPEEAAADAPSVYSQLEAILTALPEDASPAVRRQAGEMLHTMFGEYLIERLELKEEKTV